MSDQRWCIVGDGDGHHWLCPAEFRPAAWAALDAIEGYWARDEIGDAPELPEYLVEIGGPGFLTFTNPVED